VDTLVAEMKTLGLNELWLDVFSDGKTHFSAGNAAPNDVLAEALRATQGANIRVLAVMDLFDWGADTPEGLQDRTILGETEPQAVTPRSGKPASPASVTVSPFVPEVRGALLSVVRALAERSGVAGLVWRGRVTPPGYASANPMDGTGAQLGYAEPARLSFLRVAHADPVDIPGPAYSRANLNLPGFDDDALAASLQARWDTARADALRTLLRSLRAAAPAPGHGRQPFLYVNEGSAFSRDVEWFGSWDGPPAPLPAYHYAWELPQTAGRPSVVGRSAIAQAKAQSRSALTVFPVSGLSASEAARWIQDRLKNAPWDGVVLDAGTSGDADTLAKWVP
jgi:hypothetical protein